MAKYWVYLNDQVKGPYEVDELIRLPGFSRQTMVSVDDHSGGVGRWISPADIPDLARIFQKVDELHDAPVPVPRPAPKPVKPRMPARLTPVPPPVVEAKRFSGAWIWVLLFSALVGGGIFRWLQIQQRQQGAVDQQTAQAMIETVPLPPSSQYSSLRQYIQSQQVSARWEFEHTPAGLYNVTLSWLSQGKPGQMPVYAFEANLQAQSVRGLNTAAIKLLAEGFPSPKSKPAPAVAAKSKKSPGDFFPGAINDRRQAFESGDFDTVWKLFSRRRQNEMEQGGISTAGFVRMQKLTYRPGSGIQQTIVKTKTDSDITRLVLLRQTQPKHPDIYIKQTWIWENDTWHLDEEEKKMATAVLPPESERTSETPSAPADNPPPAAGHTVPASLPGLSDPAQ